MRVQFWFAILGLHPLVATIGQQSPGLQVVFQMNAQDVLVQRMKVALIGDVHANLPALEAVLDHISKQEVEAIWNVGDFVGYGAFPDEVVHLLRERGAVSILGNYDRKVLRFPQKRAKWRTSKTPDKFAAFEWAHCNLSPDSREYLASLSQARIVGIAVAGPDGDWINLSIRRPDGKLYIVTVDCDQEGNGPGFLNGLPRPDER